MEPPTVPLSFANNFWGKDDAGVGPLTDRMHAAKTTCDELKVFYNARASIEEDYARKLLALCRKPLGSQETGSLRLSLDTVRGEVESMAKQHTLISSQMKTELEEPLGAFTGSMKERRKIIQNHIDKLHKSKNQQTQHVNKTRDRFEQECLKIKGYLAQGHMVMGQEERKNKAKLEKTQVSLAMYNTEYETAVKALEETTLRWNRDWKSAADKFQDLEEERLDFLKNSLWTFANIASTVCVSDDASCEKIRLSLEKMDVEKDIISFIQERGTGQEIPDAPKYINFCRGDLNDPQIEGLDGDGVGYSVAQFTRQVNPAFRSSSPPLAAIKASPASSELSTTAPDLPPGTVTNQIIRNTPQAQAQLPSPQAPQKPTPPQQHIEYPTGGMGNSASPTKSPQDIVASNQYNSQSVRARQGGRMPVDLSQVNGNFPQVPHDPYPLEGMTMLCRSGPSGQQTSPHSPTTMSPHNAPPQSTPTGHGPPPPALPGSEVSVNGGSNMMESGRNSGREYYQDYHQDPTGKVSPTKNDYGPSTPSGQNNGMPYGHPTSQQQQQLPPSQPNKPLSGGPGAGDERRSSPSKRTPGFFQTQSPFRRRNTETRDPSQAPPIQQQHQPTPPQSQPPSRGPPVNSSQASTDHIMASSPGGVSGTGSMNQQQRNGYSSSQPPHHQSHNSAPANSLVTGRSRPDSPGPSPIEGNASLALGVGPNVLPISSGRPNTNPAANNNPPNAGPGNRMVKAGGPQDENDPIAMALAQIDGYSSKKAVDRVSADAYHGLATPAPPNDRIFQNVVNNRVMAHGTPPPSYDQQVTLLGVPPQAHTARAMKEAAEQYTRQTRNLLNNGYQPPASASPRPGTRGGSGDVPRAVSPTPSRRDPHSRPGSRGGDPYRYDNPPAHRQPQHYGSYSHRPSSSMGGAVGPSYHSNSYNGRSSGPAFVPPPDRRGSDARSVHDTSMAMQLAHPSHNHQYPDDRMGRPQTRGDPMMGPYPKPGFAGHGGGARGNSAGPAGSSSMTGASSPGGTRHGGASSPAAGSTHQRSRSVADPNRLPYHHPEQGGGVVGTGGGEVIAYARAIYNYKASIPEELSFSKGDTLAVYEEQSDGWWRAEVVGGTGLVGLVPSNYLKKEQR